MIFDFLLILLIFALLVIIIDNSVRTPPYEGPLSDHFNGKHFSNISIGKRPLIDIKGNRYNRITSLPVFFWKKFDSNVWRLRPLESSEAKPPARVQSSEIVVTYINHSTVLIQTEGVNILTDPVWCKRIGPFSFVGPQRYAYPGISLGALPEIDCILLTHNHYDHMDIATLQKITRRDKPVIYTPLGNTKFLHKKGIYKSIDMDWGESRKLTDLISIDCVPSQHFSARAVTDRNTSLWGGFVIRTLHGDIYFAGDTGYGPSTDRIKKMYPSGFRLAFLPIGAYEPPLLMGVFHTSPDDAVKIHKELSIKHSVAIHFGTFDLALDGQDHPTERLKNILKKEENKDIQFTILQNAGSLVLS